MSKDWTSELQKMADNYKPNNNITLPPIIEDFINKLSDKNISSWNREIYVATLERVEKAISLALAKHYKDKR